MGWNDHMDGIDPADPDPGETLRGMADMVRDRQKYEPKVILCPTCHENWCRAGMRCTRCTRNIEEDQLRRELGQ